MDSKVILFLGLIALAACNDLQVGSNEGQQIFEKKEEKGWTISTQDDNVTVTANGTEVITGVNVTDLRPAKDGEVKIIDGGLGHKNVTVNLKSPGPFRGYDFDVKVYAASEEEYIKKGSDDRKHDPNVHEQVPVAEAKNGVSSTNVPPANLAKDIAVNKREASVQSLSTAAPKVVPTDGVQTSAKKVDTKTTSAVSSTESITTSTVKPESASESDGAKTNVHLDKEDREKSGEDIVKLAADHMQVAVGETVGTPTLAKNVNV